MDKLAEFILAAVIVGTTLAFGGVQPLAYTLMEIGVFLAVALTLIAQTRRGRVSLALPLWATLFAALVLLQVVPLPSRLVSWLSPARFADRNWLASTQGHWSWASLSIYPHDTLSSLVRFLAYLSAFVLAAYLFDSRKGRSILITTLILLGAGEAAYGITQHVLGWHKIFNYVNEYAAEEATGTYINRNHFAGFLELTIPFVMALVFHHFQRWSSRFRRGEGLRASGGRSSSGAASLFYLNLAVVMGIGVVFSLSRTGILSTGVGILFIGVLARLRTRQKTWTLGLLVLLAGVFGYGLWIGLGPVLARFEQVERPGFVNIEGRVFFWKDTLRMVRDYPLTGTGFGTFGVAFPHYQTSAIGSFVAHAHNDYLEFASDAGLVGAALIFLPIYWLLGQMVTSFLDDPRFYRRAVTLGCVGSTLMLLLHSFMDFNLQIPANALILSVILGIGYKAACLERKEESGAAPVAVSPVRHRVNA